MKSLRSILMSSMIYIVKRPRSVILTIYIYILSFYFNDQIYPYIDDFFRFYTYSQTLLTIPLQVKAVNGWLTYGEPLHRLREFGCILKECDLIDESLMTSEQMKVMCAYLLGDGKIKTFPCPEMNWEDFNRTVTTALATTKGKVYDPLNNDLRPWVNMADLCSLYGYKGASSSVCQIS